VGHDVELFGAHGNRLMTVVDVVSLSITQLAHDTAKSGFVVVLNVNVEEVHLLQRLGVDAVLAAVSVDEECRVAMRDAQHIPLHMFDDHFGFWKLQKDAVMHLYRPNDYSHGPVSPHNCDRLSCHVNFDDGIQPTIISSELKGAEIGVVGRAIETFEGGVDEGRVDDELEGVVREEPPLLTRLANQIVAQGIVETLHPDAEMRISGTDI